MSVFSKTELKTLVNSSEQPSVSIYLPTVMAGPETRQNPIRFKNILGKAEENLMKQGLRDTEAQDLLKPAANLVESYDFWQHQNQGLALFLTENMFRYYRLPLEFEEMAIAADSFHLKPLMPFLSGDGRFYILALSQNEIRLFQGSHYSVSQIDLDDLPRSLSEALKYDDPEKQLQLHSGNGKGNPIYHGQGVGNTSNKNEILRFFQIIDSEIKQFLGDEAAPLVLAGVEYLFSIYREANSYSHLLAEGVTGNPDVMSSEELHEQAWKVVKPYFEEERKYAAGIYGELLGKGLATSNLQQILSTAYQGQVDTLFVATGEQKWGKFEPEANEVEFHEQRQPSDEDLLNLAAIHTLMNSGVVYAVDSELVPDNAPMAATWRYPVYSTVANV